ncbi:MFS transporter [Pseudofrankia inefficax]|uniref:Drug resistance transporter, EmrB/QacA subfamily n=1 Tax=Pseudofrankia inefficax (strain DSM 45817 / CECT 9037 / DDB 130130 / EuI1c) TaxID=298654 RepID=E3JCW5_PSEI1|nr:MFS transporter [Pseudofrankia inefficax]ADP81104.1 drug resistance transporter, EmrB/QacA subfamily [Pseudofrankia inefficax]
MTHATPNAPEPRGRTAPPGWLVLAVIAASQAMVVLDVTIVNVALPDIGSSLGFANQSDLQWVVNGYALTFGGFLLLGGKVADRFGRRRLFSIGVGLFGLASLVGGFAGTPGLLIGARAVQGVGGALMAPAALSLLALAFAEGEARNKALGIFAAVSGTGGAFGLVLGGVLTDEASWRWVLFINAPIAVFVLALTPRVLQESRDEAAGGFDALGAVTVTAGLGALVFALVRANEAGWTSVQTIGLLVGAVVLLVAFWVRQAQARNPLVPLSVIRRGSVAGADLSMLFVSAASVGTVFVISLVLQTIHGYSPLRTGFAFLPLSFAIAFSAQIASGLLGRVGARTLTVLGLLLTAVGIALFARITPDSGYLGVVLPAFLISGVGTGIAFVSVMSAGVAGAAPEDAGIASGLVNAVQPIGASLGIAALTAVANARFDALTSPTTSRAGLLSAQTSAWAWGFGLIAALLVVGALIAALAIRDPSPPAVPVDDTAGEAVKATA